MIKIQVNNAAPAKPAVTVTKRPLGANRKVQAISAEDQVTSLRRELAATKGKHEHAMANAETVMALRKDRIDELKRDNERLRLVVRDYKLRDLAIRRTWLGRHVHRLAMNQMSQ